MKKIILFICLLIFAATITAKENEFKIALADTNGNLISKVYDNIQPLGHGFFIMEKNHRYGMLKVLSNDSMSFTCTEALPCKYVKISPFEDGLSIIMNEENEFAVVDTTLQTVIPFSFMNIGFYHKGTFIVTEVNNKAIGKTYIIDTVGNKISEPVFADMRPLEGNPDLIIAGGAWSEKSFLINRKGEILLSYEGKEILDAGCGLLALADKDQVYKYAMMSAIPPPLLIRYDIIDTEGNILYPDYLSYSSPKFENGLMRIYKQEISGRSIKAKKMGAINKYGETVIPCIYDYVTIRPEEFTYIQGGDRATVLTRFALINNTTESTGFVYVENDNKFGALDMSGNEIIPPIYDYVEYANEGLFVVKMDNKFGYINTKGETAIPFEYEFADKFIDGFARSKKGRLGVINTKGETVIPFIYHNMWEIDNGFVMAEKLSDWGLLYVSGKELTPFQYEVIYPFPSGEKNWFKAEGGAGESYGIIDTDNNIILPLKFRDVWKYADGLFIVRLH